MKRLITLALSLTLVMFLAVGCKSTTSASPPASSATSASAAPVAAATTCPSQATDFAKTKFTAHAALGFGAFHRYIYKPFRAGTFKSGAHGRLLAFVKAGLAALFVEHEIREAGTAAQNSPTLCKLILTPLRTVSETVQAAVDKLKGGDASGISTVQNAVTQAESGAKSQGAAIVENQTASVG